MKRNETSPIDGQYEEREGIELNEGNSTDYFDFSIPSRQSGAAILLILVKLVKVLARQLWPLLLIIIFNKNQDSDYFYLKLFGGLAAFAAIRSVIGWFKFYFYIQNDELVIEKGVFTKSKLNVPIDRVQTVNFSQNIIHQFFNLVSVEIDTAGSSGKEFIIQALDKKRAEAFRKYIELHKHDFSPADISIDQTPATKEKKELILQLTPSDLLKIGISQNHLRTAGIITAFFWSFIDDIERVFDWEFIDAVEEWIIGSSSFFLFLLVVIPFFLFLSFLLTLINSVLRDFNLKFWKTTTGFKVHSGLFTRRENSANLHKIQLMQWSSTPIKRFFNLFTLRLSQAASRAITRKTAVNIPGIYTPQLEHIQQIWFPAWMHLIVEQHNISKLITWRKVLYQGVLPAIGLVVIFWSSWNWIALVWLLLIGLVWIWADRYYKTWVYEVCEEGLRTGSGVITRTHILLQWYKIQGVRIRQGLYQQRKGVADLIFYTAAGSVKIPYVELDKAKTLRDFVIFKIEIDNRKWM